MALAQSPVCVSSRLFDRGASPNEYLKILEDGDESLPRTLMAAGGKVTGTAPYFTAVAK